jgi:hypothetical protein
MRTTRKRKVNTATSHQTVYLVHFLIAVGAGALLLFIDKVLYT